MFLFESAPLPPPPPPPQAAAAQCRILYYNTYIDIYNMYIIYREIIVLLQTYFIFFFPRYTHLPIIVVLLFLLFALNGHRRGIV